MPHGQTESGGRVLAVNAGTRAPRGGVTRQGVVRTDLHSPRDVNKTSRYLFVSLYWLLPRVIKSASPLPSPPLFSPLKNYIQDTSRSGAAGAERVIGGL